MSTLRLLPVLLALSLSGCIIHIHDEGGDWSREDSQLLQGSGQRATRTREIGEFRRLKLALAGDVRLVAGAAPRLELSGDDNLLEHVRTRIIDGELVIDSDGEPLRFREGLRIELATGALEAATLSGSGTLALEELSGERFEASLTGAGTIRARGAVARAALSVSGSGRLDCGGLVADELQIGISGSASAHVHASRRLAVTISGSGDVRYGGSPSEITRSVAGSGTIAPE